MTENDLPAILDFLKATEPLKDTLRRSRTAGGRVESTAEHSWRLCLMAMLFEDHYPDIDIVKLIKICIIHDLGEVISGDIAAVDQIAGENKNHQERKDLEQLAAPLPNHLKAKILSLWDEYDNAQSKEARLAKAFDKLETILQHIQGKNPPDFNHEFNLDYGRQYTDFDRITKKLRAMVDKETRRLAKKNSPAI